MANLVYMYVVELSGSFINLEAIDLIQPRDDNGYTIHLRGGTKHVITRGDYITLKERIGVLNS